LSFDVHNQIWSRAEKAVARRAFDQALARECSSLEKEVRKRANRITEPRHIWALHDFLTRKRKEIDLKYNYRYSQLIFVFARLIQDGWLSEDELEGLAEDKLAKIRAVLEL
jgi:Photoprotection regulator fluorescence recovery protein